MVETRSQATLKAKRVEMSLEIPKSNSSAGYTRVEENISTSSSGPAVSPYVAEFAQDQSPILGRGTPRATQFVFHDKGGYDSFGQPPHRTAIPMEELMAKQTYRIETSFMAAMDRIASQLRTLFEERLPIAASSTPSRATQSDQRSERLESQEEGSSLGAIGNVPTTSYGQYSQPQANNWGQSQQTWFSPGPTYSAEVLRGQLQTAVPIGQNSLTYSAAQQLGPIHTVAVQTQVGSSTMAVIQPQQYGQGSMAAMQPLQMPIIPSGVQIQGGPVVPIVPHPHLGPAQSLGLYSQIGPNR